MESVLGISQVISQGRPDDVGFGLVPRDSGTQAVGFQPQEGLEGHLDVIALSLCRTHLAFLHATTLFEAPVVRFDSPGLARQAFSLLLRHFQVIGGPVFHVPVFGNRPKHSDKSIASQMHLSAFPGYRHGGQGQVPRSLGVHPPVGPQLAHPEPSLIPDGFQILQAGIPTVEQHPTGLKAPLELELSHPLG